MMKTLDDRIKENLEEIYVNTIVPLKDIIQFVDQYKKFKFAGAVELSDIFKNPTGAEEVISTHGLPSFFVGKRDADTVMLMLNPGQDVALADCPITTCEKIKRGNKIGKGININSLNDFISSYKIDSINYGDIDVDRPDNFDLKQAAFLKHWVGCGVHFAGFLDDDYKKLGDSKEDVDKKEVINKKAKRNVLMEKLSLDLIPYASRKFVGIDTKKIDLLFPYLETLFHEIFQKERKYVIFCSDFYNTLFQKYNAWNKGIWKIIIYKKHCTNTVLANKNAYCTPIKILQKNNGKEQKAIIAHTFPNQSLPNAYDKMEEYGSFCFDVWKNKNWNSKPIP